MHPSRNDGHFLPILSETLPKNGISTLRHCGPPASDLKIKEKSMPAAPIGDVASGDSRGRSERWKKTRRARHHSAPNAVNLIAKLGFDAQAFA
jgi:hypothetical protein